MHGRTKFSHLVSLTLLCLGVMLMPLFSVQAATRTQQIQNQVKKAAEEHAQQVEEQGFPPLQPKPTPSPEAELGATKSRHKPPVVKILNTWWDGRVILKSVDGLWVIQIYSQPR